MVWQLVIRHRSHVVAVLSFAAGCLVMLLFVAAGWLSPVERQPTTGAWGTFVGSPKLELMEDGRNAKLLFDVVYIDRHQHAWLARAGDEVNGASIPKPLWSLVGGPFEGKYRDASVVHDTACVAMEMPWEDVHLMFYEACRCRGLDEYKAKVLYAGVYHFGPRWPAKRVMQAPIPPPPPPVDADGFPVGPGTAGGQINATSPVSMPDKAGDKESSSIAIEELEKFIRTKDPSLEEIRALGIKRPEGPK